MNQKEIVKFLIQNDLSDVEVLKGGKEYLLVNFYLDFDNDILNAARAYANEECNEEEESTEWLKEYYFTYLYDYANDEVLSIIEEISEEFEISSEFMAFQIKELKDEYVQFMALFSEEDTDIGIEEAVKDYIN